MASRTTPFDIQTIPRYLASLQIYRIAASGSWQMRMFVDRKYVRKSADTADKKLAIEFAKSLYDTIRINQRLDVSVHTDTFHACAQHLIRRQETLVATGPRDDRINTEDNRKLKADILPFFGMMGFSSITASTLDDYIADLGRRKKLSPSAIAKHLVVVRKVLTEAQKRGFLTVLPPFPVVRKKENPRPYFSTDEYRKLRISAKSLSEEGLAVRGVPLTEEISSFRSNWLIRADDDKAERSTKCFWGTKPCFIELI